MLAALFAVVQRRWTNTDASESEIAGFAHTLFFSKGGFFDRDVVKLVLIFLCTSPE